MNLVIDNQGINVSFERVPVLVLENPQVMTEVVTCLVNASSGDEKDMVLSEENEPVSFQKNAELILSPLLINLNDSKIIKKLYKNLQDDAQEYDEIKAHVNTQMVQLFETLQAHSAYAEIKYDLEIDWENIFKMYHIGIDDEEADITQRVISLIKILAGLMHIRLICFVNLKSFLTNESVSEIYKMAEYYGMNLLLVENREYEKLEAEQIYIVDMDRCVIIK